jgi:hypothetical protein
MGQPHGQRHDPRQASQLLTGRHAVSSKYLSRQFCRPGTGGSCTSTGTTVTVACTGVHNSSTLAGTHVDDVCHAHISHSSAAMGCVTGRPARLHVARVVIRAVRLVRPQRSCSTAQVPRLQHASSTRSHGVLGTPSTPHSSAILIMYSCRAQLGYHW